MSLSHDLVCTGHQGVQRTRERIKARYYWYRMHSDVRGFVKSCNKCNRNKKASRKAKAPMTKYHAGSPMERVHLDFLGPLPETPRGNTNILVMVDQFTKWCEIVPLPSQTAKTTAKAAVNEFFARFVLSPYILTKVEALRASYLKRYVTFSISTKPELLLTDLRPMDRLNDTTAL